jgi:hypothetical protein
MANQILKINYSVDFLTFNAMYHIHLKHVAVSNQGMLKTALKH